MDGWDFVLLAVAAYIAVVTLVRLMLRRREQLVARFRQQMAQQAQARALQERAKETPGEERRAA